MATDLIAFGSTGASATFDLENGERANVGMKRATHDAAVIVEMDAGGGAFVQVGQLQLPSPVATGIEGPGTFRLTITQGKCAAFRA